MATPEVYGHMELTILDSAGDTLNVVWSGEEHVTALFTAKQAGRRASAINVNAEARGRLIRMLGGTVRDA